LIYEASAYRYKIDPVTDEILPIPLDENNHGFDSIRYALDPLITRGCTVYDHGVLT
jgi:phage terminase large subunit